METAIIEAEPLQKESTGLVLKAQEVTEITTSVHYENAVHIGKALRAMNKGILEFWKPLVEAAHRSHKALCVRRDEMTKPVDSAIAAVDAKIGSYLYKQEQERLQREREAQEAAHKAEQDRLLREAQSLSELGRHEESEAVLDEAVNVAPPPVILASSVPKVSGVAQRTVWKWRVKDASQVKREYLMPDETKINQLVRALKGSAAATIGGIEVWEEKAVSMRS
jgi:hypothetical protein